ncbi:MAG: PilZ domain-containing protein [Gammaproteobacteria bacterium]
MNELDMDEFSEIDAFPVLEGPSDADFDKPLEEHIEMESMTGRFRRDAVQAALNRAEAEALANKRRHMRIPADSFVAKYLIGDDPDKFSLFGFKKCAVVDASITGIGIEAKKGLHKGDKLVLIISDGKNGEIPEFEIIATIMYAGNRGGKKVSYGLQFDEKPTIAYTDAITRQTLKIKMTKAKEKEIL